MVYIKYSNKTELLFSASMRVHFRTKQRQQFMNAAQAVLKQQRVRSRLNTVNYLLWVLRCFEFGAVANSIAILSKTQNLLELWQAQCCNVLNGLISSYTYNCRSNCSNMRCTSKMHVGLIQYIDSTCTAL